MTEYLQVNSVLSKASEYFEDADVFCPERFDKLDPR